LEKRIIEEDGKSIEKEEISRQAKAILEEAERKAAAIIEEAKKEAAAILAQVLERRFPSSYTVRVGDKLRLIASRREIYNDPYQWPLIYKANRDQIRDPHMLFVGQQLIIPRDLMIKEVKEARKQAGASPPYDIPPEAFHPSDYK
jgi:nucleoid-associated protein YgaU